MPTHAQAGKANGCSLTLNTPPRPDAPKPSTDNSRPVFPRGRLGTGEQEQEQSMLWIWRCSTPSTTTHSPGQKMRSSALNLVAVAMAPLSLISSLFFCGPCSLRHRFWGGFGAPGEPTVVEVHVKCVGAASGNSNQATHFCTVDTGHGIPSSPCGRQHTPATTCWLPITAAPPPAAAP